MQRKKSQAVKGAPPLFPFSSFYCLGSTAVCYTYMQQKKAQVAKGASLSFSCFLLWAGELFVTHACSKKPQVASGASPSAV